MADQTLPTPEPGFSLAVSVSRSPDVTRLGLTDVHVDMALGEVARAVLIARGRLTYGGHLGPDGYTAFLVHECEKYGADHKPFTASVPWPVHRNVPLDVIDRLRREISVFGRYDFLDPDGNVLLDHSEGRGSEPEEVDPETTVRALTAMRERVTRETDGRLVLGGKRSDFAGRIPGVVEEAVLSIRTQQPLFIAGGFGGAAGDIAVAVGLDPAGWLGLPDRSGDDDIRELLDAAADARFDPTDNGLTLEQNRQLAVSYRASEIASLVVVGLTTREENQ